MLLGGNPRPHGQPVRHAAPHPKPKPAPRPRVKVPRLRGKAAPVGATPAPRPGRVSIPHPGQPLSPYVNPFAGARISPARIDMGVDYFGRGNIGAIGPGVITASGQAWSGAVGAPSPGTWITEKITAGPLKGQQWYVAEDVQPFVKTGQKVKAGQPIGKFVAGSGGVQYATEVGFAAPGAAGAGGQTMADYAGQAAGGRDPGARSTAWGVSASNLLSRLGAAAGILTPGGITGTAPSFGTGGKVSGRVSMPPPGPPIVIPSGVNPPASGGTPTPSIRLTAATTSARASKLAKPVGPPVVLPPGTTVPPFRTPPPSPGGVTTTTPPTFINSSVGQGGVTPVAAPSTSSGGGGSTLLLVAGAGVVLVLILFARKKGK